MSSVSTGIPSCKHWTQEIDENRILWLGLDKQDSRVNTLSREVMAELDLLLGATERLRPRGLVIFSRKPGSFVAGADISEFPLIQSEEEAQHLSEQGQQILARLESLPCSSVAALNGNALGGGLELALAATWRIALPVEEPCLGLPEVKLGLHPGFGGTVRMVRLLGVRRGMDLMLSGRSVAVGDALRYGLVDHVSTAETWRRDATIMLGRTPPARRVPPLDRLLGLPFARHFVAKSMTGRVGAKANPAHYPAPFAMIDLWRSHGAAGKAAYEAEARSFGRLAMTRTSRNLVRVFFLQDRLKKLGAPAAVSIKHVHVVGAGVMGGDIAAWCALRGMTVSLQDRDMKYVQPAIEKAARLFDKRIRSESGRKAAMDRLAADIAGEGAASADVVVEAIYENLDAKRELFKHLEPVVPAHCLIATNTSSIPLQDLMGALRHPERLVGLHFFNPVAKLPLVEVVQTDGTSPEFLRVALAFTRQIGKLPLPCKSQPGFLVNRILAAYMAEAMTLAHEGIPLPDIDLAATDFGMPVGPVELADSVGLDIALHVARTLSPLVRRPVSPELETMVRDGHLGLKTGHGFYLYRDGQPVKPQSAARVRRELQDRLIMALLNEAAQCLDEGVVADADLVDAGVIFGTGFAPFHGGPLHYAAEQGLDKIVSKLGDLSRQLGPRFTPSAGWDKMRTL